MNTAFSPLKDRKSFILADHWLSQDEMDIITAAYHLKPTDRKHVYKFVMHTNDEGRIISCEWIIDPCPTTPKPDKSH